MCLSFPWFNVKEKKRFISSCCYTICLFTTLWLKIAGPNVACLCALNTAAQGAAGVLHRGWWRPHKQWTSMWAYSRCKNIVGWRRCTCVFMNLENHTPISEFHSPLSKTQLGLPIPPFCIPVEGPSVTSWLLLSLSDLPVMHTCQTYVCKCVNLQWGTVANKTPKYLRMWMHTM